MKKKLFVLMVAILMAPGAVWAANVLHEARGLQVVKTLFPPQVKIVGARDLGDVYELVVQPPKGAKRVYYATKDGNYLIAGNLFNRDKVNVTRERLEQVDRVDVSTLPLKEALKIKKGNGAKKLIMFADVDCPFCRRAYGWLMDQNNYTLYVFFYPLSIHPHSHAKTVAILCSNDPLGAFKRAISGQDAGDAKCSAGVKLLAKEEKLAERVGIDGTPLFIMDSGARIVGANIPALAKYLGH